ncbi:MAG: copper chaperone PCu(A)C [Gammaproteobacteria bacterium]|jgi:copper(I)-binding protein
MKRILLGLALTASSWLAGAQTDIEVEHAWVREAPPGARMLAAYMTLKNTGERERVLVEVQSPTFRHVMLHRSEVVEGVARMIHLDEIAIPAGETVALKPSGLHLMMPAPETRLTAGDRVEFVLIFADGSSVEAQAEVRKKP